MACTKIIAINHSLSKAINYIKNGDKTQEGILCGAHNCLMGAELEQMNATKEKYGKTGGRLGYHIIQSFIPGELSPELAHQIAKEYIEEYLSGYEVVYATHTDKNHVHNHLLINSVSFVDGRKFHCSKQEYYQNIRGISDRICKAHGLSVIIEYGGKSMHYKTWLDDKSGTTTWRSMIRQDLDDAIDKAYSFGNFIVIMEHKGYEIKHGKHIAFRPKGKERFARGYKIGSEYSEEGIRARIDGKPLIVPPIAKKPKRRMQYATRPALKLYGWMAQYYYYLHILNLVKKKPPKKAVFPMREELLKMTKYKEQYKFLHKNKILNKSDLDAYAKSVRDKLDNLIAGKDAFYEAKKPLTKHFNNITLLSALEGPHEMYIEGYYEMKEEHDAYIKAKEELAKAGYGDDLALKELYSIKVEMYENITKSWEAIHACKAELKMCEQVEKSSEDIKTKLNELKKGDGKDEPGRGRPSI